MTRSAVSRVADDAEASGPRARDSLEIVIDTEPAPSERIARPELAAIGRFAGYELLGRIAVGGMAEVFLARESQGGAARMVALKVIRAQLERDRNFAEMFMREGAVALGLRHPNVCHVYRFGMEGGHPFLAMELVDGISVRDLIRRARRAGKTIPAPIAAKIASSVAEGLHSAHVARDERGQPLEIVHQDVSPHNVMVAWDGTVKLLDFGVAQSALETSVTTSSETSHTTIRGKLAYLSPEQCTGARVDARSDVFTLGVVLHEMLTGERLFKRDQTLATMRAIAAEPLPTGALDGVPEPLAKVIAKAISKRPQDRYADAAEMQEALERYLADERIVVTSGKIAAALVELVGDARGRAPELDTSPEVAAWLGDSGRARDDGTAAPIPLLHAKERRRGGVVLWLGAAVVVLGGIAGAFFAMRAGESEVAAPVAGPAAEVVPAPSAAPLEEGVAVEAPADEPEVAAELAAPSEVRAAEPGTAEPGTAEPGTAEPGTAAARAAEPSSEAAGAAREARRAERARRRASAPAAGDFLEDPGF